MPTTALFNYPEFLLAGLIGIVAWFSLRNEQREVHFPTALSEAAENFLVFAPDVYLNWLNKSLTQAGWRSNQTFADFASWKLYPASLSLLLSFVLPLHIVLIIALVVSFIPDIVLYICLKRRQGEIRDSLPQAIDLMVLCVDAGLGLDATMRKIASESTGLANALNDELNILGREILLGLDREKAYKDLYLRTGLDELKTFGSALTQASKLGLSVSQILRAQSDFIRKRQSQKIEEKAMKMPIYMAFPLWFCIMPCLMLLVLGPSLIKFYHQMHIAQSGF